MKKIIIVGSLNVDISLTVEELPAEGQTVKGNKMQYSNGGKGANQACTVSQLYSGQSVMLGCVGQDPFGRELLTQLKRHNLDVENIELVTGQNTGTAVVCVDAKGRNSIVVVPNANAFCNVEYLKRRRNVLRQADYLLIQNEVPIETVEYAIEEGHRTQATIVFNPAPAPRAIKKSIIEKIDFLTPNESELSCLTDSKSTEVLVNANKLIQMGVKNVIVTLGAKGALWVNKQGSQLVKGHKVETVSTVGAGDVFNGAFVSALATEKSIPAAIEFANAAAALSVTKNGAIDSIPSYAEVVGFMGDLF